jgi:hypothetical protein
MPSAMTDPYAVEDEEIVEGYEHPEEEDDAGDLPEEPVPRWRKSPCPKHEGGHEPVLDQRKGTYICAYCAKTKWTGSELEAIADVMLREDSNAELCRVCVEEAKKFSAEPYTGPLVIHSAKPEKKPEAIPYGTETGHIEWQIQKDKEGNILLDDEDNALYVGFPELKCAKGHRWYKGEGPRRNINGVNPILFETHLYNRKRREIQVKEGVPDPAYTMDRWNKRPTQGMYYRTHPQGRKVNTPDQRKKNGASYYR